MSCSDQRGSQTHTLKVQGWASDPGPQPESLKFPHVCAHPGTSFTLGLDSPLGGEVLKPVLSYPGGETVPQRSPCGCEWKKEEMRAGGRSGVRGGCRTAARTGLEGLVCRGACWFRPDRTRRAAFRCLRTRRPWNLRPPPPRRLQGANDASVVFVTSAQVPEMLTEGRASRGTWPWERDPDGGLRSSSFTTRLSKAAVRVTSIT